MDFNTFAKARLPALAEGSMYEKLRRDPDAGIDPFIFHASLIYDDHGRAILEHAHRGYLDIGQRLELPMIATTATWRANHERIALSDFSDRPVNRDNAEFLLRVRDSYGRSGPAIYVGGQIGPRGDAYNPAEAPSTDKAAIFHRPQVDALAEGGVEFLSAATLPALPEAIGIAQAMASTGLPYLLSFVVRHNGALLDGTTLSMAIQTLDKTKPYPPVGYFVNCVHPDILGGALRATAVRDPIVVERILGFLANTSDLDPEKVDGIEELQTEDPEHLADIMMRLHDTHDIPILGGCCGTDVRHIESIGRALKEVA